MEWMVDHIVVNVCDTVECRTIRIDEHVFVFDERIELLLD